MKLTSIGFAVLCLFANTLMTAQTINISTGLNASGACAANATADAHWKVSTAGGSPSNLPTYVVPNYTIGSTVYWQPTPLNQGCGCAGWINPAPSYTTPVGVYTFERTIAATATKQIDFDFRIAYDDDLVSLEIVSPSGAVDNLTAMVVRSTSPTGYYLSNTIKKSYSCPTVSPINGNWILRAKVKYHDNPGGFLLAGCARLTPGECQTRPCPIKIQGTNNICRYQKQALPFATYSAVGAAGACTYNWTVLPASVTFTGQGSGTIQITSIPVGVTNFTVQVTASCTNNPRCPQYASTIFPVTVSLIADASFNMNIATTGSNVNINCVPTQPACQHFWFLYKADCTTKNPMGAPLAVVNTPVFNHTGLLAGQCYVVYHYVRCGNCKWAFKRRFFTVTPAARRAAAPEAEDEIEAPAELKEALQRELQKAPIKE